MASATATSATSGVGCAPRAEPRRAAKGRRARRRQSFSSFFIFPGGPPASVASVAASIARASHHPSPQPKSTTRGAGRGGGCGARGAGPALVRGDAPAPRGDRDVVALDRHRLGFFPVVLPAPRVAGQEVIERPRDERVGDVRRVRVVSRVEEPPPRGEHLRGIPRGARTPAHHRVDVPVLCDVEGVPERAREGAAARRGGRRAADHGPGADGTREAARRLGGGRRQPGAVAARDRGARRAVWASGGRAAGGGDAGLIPRRGPGARALRRDEGPRRASETHRRRRHREARVREVATARDVGAGREAML